jgi:hypothetical protein
MHRGILYSRQTLVRAVSWTVGNFAVLRLSITRFWASLRLTGGLSWSRALGVRQTDRPTTNTCPFGSTVT